MMPALNGWTPERLYGLQQKVDATHAKVVEIETDVSEIKGALQKMQSEETQSLRHRVKELEEKPHKQLANFVIPFVCACIPAIPALLLLLNHA